MERLELMLEYIIPAGAQVQLPEFGQAPLLGLFLRSQLYITEISLCGPARAGGAGGRLSRVW